MLCLAELRRACQALDERLLGHRLERIVQPGEHRIVLSFYGRTKEGRGVKRHLLLSCSPDFGRASELQASPRAPENPPAFSSFLRAHLARARLVELRMAPDDRQLTLCFDAREGRYDLILSLLGRRGNLYVVDAQGLLVAALRPLEQTRRSLHLGGEWTDPPPQPGGSRGEGEDRWPECSPDEYLKSIEESYVSRESERQGRDLAQQLAKALSRELKQARRRVERIEAELAEADQATPLQRRGELLKSVLGKIAPGASEIVAKDYETGEQVTIPLDSAKSAKENLELTFKRYQKMIRRLAKAGGQIDEARAYCEQIEALSSQVAGLAQRGEEGRAELEALASEPLVAKLVGKRVGQRSGALPATDEDKQEKLPARLRGLPRKLLPRRYLSADGLEIWVGRNDAGNDYLSTRLARGKDLFFHLDGAPGSHVVLRTEGRSDPPSESVLDACELAVRFSKQKNASRADVHVVPIKQVKKPKGAKPGLVWVTGGKSVHLRRDEKRLERVLASKIPD